MAKSDPRFDETILPDGYTPSADEPFMNLNQIAYFKKKLLDWREDVLDASSETIHHLQEESHKEPDVSDQASQETDRSLELRTRDRGRKLLAKIDQALKRIEDGSYGYCVETGEPISLQRLEARPVATLCLEAQEKHERQERTHKDI